MIRVRILLSIALLTLLILDGNAQLKHARNWITGGGKSYKIAFDGGLVTKSVFDTNYLFYFVHGHSCISDSVGNFRLLSDGARLFDTLGNIISNGDSLIPDEIYKAYDFGPAPQSSIILPFQNEIYCVITPTASDSEMVYNWIGGGPQAVFDLLLYHKVDMQANGGAGLVVKKKAPLLDHVRLSKSQMMACRHADGVNWWLLKQAQDTNLIYKFVVTKDSIYNMGVQGFSLPKWGPNDVKGQMMFNSAGNKYITVNNGCKSFFIANFDRCNGMLSNPKILNIPQNLAHPAGTVLDTFLRGACFSPNDSFLYIATFGNLYQLELNNPDSSAAWHRVANLDTTWAAFNGWANIYSGPDGKLYVGNSGGLGKAMSVINTPNAKGASCDFCPKCLRFGHIGTTAPPCMPNYALGKDTTVICWPMGLSESGRGEREANWVVYPNPAQTQLSIESEAFKKGLNYLRIFNLMGQCVLEEEFKTVSGKHTVSVRGLPAGVYVVRVNGGVRRVLKE